MAKPVQKTIPLKEVGASMDPKYAPRSHDASTAGRASPWVARYLGLIAPAGLVLDVAAGRGRHALLAAGAGHRVTAVDRAYSVEQPEWTAGTGVTTIPADLETGVPPPWTGQRFDGVIVTNYLWRPLLGAIIDAVADDGVLIYETFAYGQEQFGRPSNPDFLLAPGELIEAVRGRLIPLSFEHRRLEEPLRVVQRIMAVGARHQALADPHRLPI